MAIENLDINIQLLEASVELTLGIITCPFRSCQLEKLDGEYFQMWNLFEELFKQSLKIHPAKVFSHNIS